MVLILAVLPSNWKTLGKWFYLWDLFFPICKVGWNRAIQQKFFPLLFTFEIFSVLLLMQKHPQTSLTGWRNGYRSTLHFLLCRLVIVWVDQVTYISTLGTSLKKKDWFPNSFDQSGHKETKIERCGVKESRKEEGNAPDAGSSRGQGG